MIGPSTLLLEQIGPSIQDVGRQRVLEHEILQIADREKRRIACDLHDGLCQSLAGIAALMSTLSRRLGADGQRGSAVAADEIVRLLIQTIGEARDVVHGLGSIGGNGSGLAGRLDSLARNIRRTRRATCTLICKWCVSSLSCEMQTHLLRIAQEGVRNALAHGRADHIDICLECIDASGVLSIRDNGVGIAEDGRSHDGMGLHIMDYRARAIGGALSVKRRPEGGTAVVCVCPLPEPGEAREGRADAPAGN